MSRKKKVRAPEGNSVKSSVKKKQTKSLEVSEAHMIAALEMYFSTMALLKPNERIVGTSYSDSEGLKIIVEKEVST
jgi:hypothetical protein